MPKRKARQPKGPRRKISGRPKGRPAHRPSPKARSKIRRIATVHVPGKWFTSSVRAGRADPEGPAREAMKREGTIQYLHDSIKLLRRFHKGFEAKDGYSLKRQSITRMPAARIARIGKMAAQLRREMSSGHIIVRPRSKASKEALYKHTGAIRDKGRKAFVVHVESPADTTVRVEHPPRQPARVIETRTMKDGAEVEQQLFYFADWSKGKPIRTMRDIIRAVKRMEPHLPKGYFLLVSKDYGNISVAIPKDRLEEELDIYYGPYDKVPGLGKKDNRGLAESLVALRYIKTRAQVDKEYKERLARRFYYARDQKRRRESARARRRRLLTGRS